MVPTKEPLFYKVCTLKARDNLSVCAVSIYKSFLSSGIWIPGMWNPANPKASQPLSGAPHIPQKDHASPRLRRDLFERPGGGNEHVDALGLHRGPSSLARPGWGSKSPEGPPDQLQLPQVINRIRGFAGQPKAASLLVAADAAARNAQPGMPRWTRW